MGKPKPTPTKRESHHHFKVARRRQAKLTKQLRKISENEIFDEAITMVEDEHTIMAKNDKNNSRLNTISAAHFNAITTKKAHTLLQR